MRVHRTFRNYKLCRTSYIFNMTLGIRGRRVPTTVPTIPCGSNKPFKEPYHCLQYTIKIAKVYVENNHLDRTKSPESGSLLAASILGFISTRFSYGSLVKDWWYLTFKPDTLCWFSPRNGHLKLVNSVTIVVIRDLHPSDLQRFSKAGDVVGLPPEKYHESV